MSMSGSGPGIDRLGIDRLEIGPRAIDVWLLYYNEVGDERLLAELRGLLAADEREKEPRFYFADDRKRYLLTRAMVRSVLSRYADVAPREWTFAANAYGRPEIANAHPDTEGLSFNLSHTRGLIVLGVSRGRALGVDVENLAVRQPSIDIANRFFSPAEVGELARVPAQRQHERFFEYWTFKESYIKARGMGLSIPLDRFGFAYPHENAVSLSVDAELGDSAERWEFWQYRPTADYLLAICAERLGDGVPELKLRKMIPTVAEETLTPQLLKTTIGR